MNTLKNLSSIYKRYYQGTAPVELYTNTVTQWEDYRKKIFNREITLENYVGSIEESPIKFLGYRAKLFVDLGGMRPPAYMIYKEPSKNSQVNEAETKEDNTPKYWISEKYNTTSKKADAKACFENNIYPLLRLIVNAIDEDGFKEENADLNNTLLENLKAAIDAEIESLNKELIKNNLDSLAEFTASSLTQIIQNIIKTFNEKNLRIDVVKSYQVNNSHLE